VKKIPVQPLQPVEAEIQQNAEDLEERQDQIREAEDAIVDETDGEEFGKAV
jgi:type IV secretory pathway VirD2 relaxase